MVKGGDMDLGFVVSAAEQISKVGRGKGVNLLWKNSKISRSILKGSLTQLILLL